MDKWMDKMDKCYYSKIDVAPTEVEGSIRADDNNNETSWKYLLRQIFICSGTWSSGFAFGLTLGSPTVFIPQLRREANSTDAITMEMASWLSSTFCYSGVVSSFILVLLAKLIGRKLAFLFVSVTSLIGYVIFYCSKTIIQILISQVIHGPLSVSPIAISIMILTEYISPRYRGVFFSLKSAFILWGIWVANTIGTFYHWKNIGILGSFCMMYTLLTTHFWPESPYWLASKNRFENCTASHRWLKGSSEKSESELEALIQSRNDYNSIKRNSQNIFRMFTSKIFYKPIYLSCLVLCMYHFSGKIACGMYAIDIIKRITKTESSAYNGMLFLDGITIVGMYLGCGLSKIFKRKTILLISTTIATVFLYSMSLYLYLINLKFISEYTVISFSFLMGYSLSISVGPMVMSATIVGELIPVKYRNSSTVILGCIGIFLMGTVVKMAPFIMHCLDIHGLFLFYAVSESLLTIIVYILLPETKDKNLLEIQKSLLG